MIISIIHCSISHTIIFFVIILDALQFIKLMSVTKRLIIGFKYTLERFILPPIIRLVFTLEASNLVCRVCLVLSFDFNLKIC